MHRLLALGRAGVDPLVAHDEVAAFDDLDAHLAGEVRVLEIGGIVGSGGQQHHRRISHAGGRDVAQDLVKLGGIVVHWPHAGAVEKPRKRPPHRAPVLQHVAHARRAAGVVLEDHVGAIRPADQVGTADVDVDVARNPEIDELATEVLGRQHIIRRDDPVLQDPLLVVDVVEEEIQRGDALDEAGLEFFPFGGGDDAGQEVEREDALRALGIAVNVEGDALPQEKGVDRAAFGVQLRPRDGAEAGDEFPIVGPQGPVGQEHFVEKALSGVAG